MYLTHPLTLTHTHTLWQSSSVYVGVRVSVEGDRAEVGGACGFLSAPVHFAFIYISTILLCCCEQWEQSAGT